MNKQDSLIGARAAFGVTYPIARAAALVLHVDVALILLRMRILIHPFCYIFNIVFFFFLSFFPFFSFFICIAYTISH